MVDTLGNILLIITIIDTSRKSQGNPESTGNFPIKLRIYRLAFFKSPDYHLVKVVQS